MNYDVTRTKPQDCPHCGYSVDSLGPSGPEARAPGDGDFVVCQACAGLMRCTSELWLVPTTLDDPNIDMDQMTELRKAIAGIEYLRTRNAHWPQGPGRKGPHRA